MNVYLITKLPLLKNNNSLLILKYWLGFLTNWFLFYDCEYEFYNFMLLM